LLSAAFWLTSTEEERCFSLAGMVKLGAPDTSTKASKLIR